MLEILTLAEASTKPEAMIPGSWVLSLVGLIITTVIGALVGKKMGQREEQAKQQTEVGPQPFQIEEVEKLATKKEVGELEKRLVGELEKIQAAQAEERRIAREAQGKVHARSDRNAEALAELKGEVHQMGKNVERLLTLATTPKPPRG